MVVRYDLNRLARYSDRLFKVLHVCEDCWIVILVDVGNRNGHYLGNAARLKAALVADSSLIRLFVFGQDCRRKIMQIPGSSLYWLFNG